MFSEKYKKIFKKLKLKLVSDNNFDIIRIWLPLLRTIFKMLKTKQKIVWETISIFEIKKKNTTIKIRE